MEHSDANDDEGQDSMYVSRFWVWCVIILVFVTIGSCADNIHGGFHCEKYEAIHF